ncbi:MAG: ribulose-phosphate 3-epimerase [Prevotella sp.]|jgi:ribulose-phosphate 3-epimerase|nr:ribulose-phosphate 3-epimerase [Prevotella sp.]
MNKKRKGEISASMMCSRLLDLKETLDIFKEEGIEHLHIDMMDGAFVPNFGLGVDYIRGLRELTDIPLDLHLMIKNPEYKLRWIGIQPTDMVSVHYESTFQVQRLLDWLKPYGCKRFIAINPATPVSSIEEVLDYVDGINLLMVNPGFAGQHIVPSTIRKVQKVVDLLKREHYEGIEIEVDGNVTPEHAMTLREIGADIFVGGTSSVFKGHLSQYSENIKLLRNNIK